MLDTGGLDRAGSIDKRWGPALFEAVLWTDTERVDDQLSTCKSVLLIDLSISYDIYGQTLGP